MRGFDFSYVYKKVAAIDLLLLLDVESYAAATGRLFATFRGKKQPKPFGKSNCHRHLYNIYLNSLLTNHILVLFLDK